MNISSLSVSLLAFSFLLGCSDDGAGTSATGLTTNATTDGSVTTGDGDGDPGDGDGDPGDGDGDPGDGDGDPGDGDGYCVHQCTSDADCTISGMNVGLTCIDSVCSGEVTSPCANDDECIARLSGWASGVVCTSGATECTLPLQLCLDIDGVGHCATGPSDLLDCAQILQDEIETVDIDGNPVVACGYANAACDADGVCTLPCASDGDCISPAYPHCDVDSGLCQCATDMECQTSGQPQSSVCNEGSCGCTDDQQCIDGNSGDTCTAQGYCGCSNDMACASTVNNYDGGAYVCVQQ
jgi:hypothetical protein